MKIQFLLIMITTMKKSIFAFIAITALFLSSCKQSDNSVTTTSKAATYYGTSMVVGGDTIRSWIKTDLNGNPSSLGVTFSKTILNALGSLPDQMFMMMLPMNAGMMIAPPFDHIELDWSKNGDPNAPFNVAQFDMHCFTVDTMTQMAVMPGMDNLTMNMDMKYLPSGYMLDMNAEAMMGVHAMDTTDHTNPFSHTIMYGFSQGNLYFMEPMVSKAYLETNTNFSADIRQPQAFKKNGWYPTKYNITFDGTSYSISIDNFVQH